jgi:hypothetical protein
VRCIGDSPVHLFFVTCVLISTVEEGTQGLHYCRLGEAIRDDPIAPGSTEAAELRVLLEAAQTVVRLVPYAVVQFTVV